MSFATRAPGLRALALAAVVAGVVAVAPRDARGQAVEESTGLRRVSWVAAGLVQLGFEDVQVGEVATPPSTVTFSVRLENRRFRDPSFAFGVIGALVAPRWPGPIEIVLLRQGLPVSRVSFKGADVAAFARGELPPGAFAGKLDVEVLPDAPALPGKALSPARLRVDLSPRVILDSQFGHLQEPLAWHLEIAPEAATRPWRGALLRAGWTFPIRHQHDIPAGDLHPDYDRARPEELALYQFHRFGGRALGSLSGGYLGANRYGVSAGLGLARGGRWFADAAADLTGSLAFYPEVTYSGLTRLTFSGGLTCRLDRPDVSFTLRGGRYLFGAEAGSGVGEYAARAEMARRFHQVDLSIFVVKSESNRYGGLRLSLPLPPMVRLRPAAVRVDPLANFPFEYRTEEALFEALPVDPRLRSGLLEDLWPASVKNQLDLWLSGYQYVMQREGPAGP